MRRRILFLRTGARPNARRSRGESHLQIIAGSSSSAKIPPGDDGARAETMVGCRPLKAVEGWTDLGLGNFELRYLRDKMKREVDFLVGRDCKRRAPDYIRHPSPRQCGRNESRRRFCLWFICATNATASCERPFTCGWTSAAIIATGRASITKRIGRKAKATPARYAASECAGLKSSRP